MGFLYTMMYPTNIEDNLDKLKDNKISQSTKLRKYLIEFSKKKSRSINSLPRVLNSEIASIPVQFQIKIQIFNAHYSTIS